MSNIQKTLDSLQPYVIGIRYLEGFPVVDALFTEGWSVPNSDTVSKAKGDNEYNYYMFFSDKPGVGLDEILSFVELTIKANLEREKKHELLKEKVNELKEVFKRNPLTKLLRLKFTFNEEELIPTINEFNLDHSEEIFIENSEPEELTPISAIEKVPVVEALPDSIPQNEIPLTEEEIEILEEEKRAENYKKIKEAQKTKSDIKKITAKVELPPKKISEAINTPQICDCGPEEACEKCIESKDY